MMRKLMTLLILMMAALSVGAFNQEFTTILDSEGEGRVRSQKLGDWGYITFKVVETNDTAALVEAVLENKDHTLALLLFHGVKKEPNFKRLKVQIEFIKTYMGDKGSRSVDGFSELPKDIMVFPIGGPEQVIMETWIPFNESVQLDIPIYLAKYNEKKFHKKGLENTKFQICEPAFNVFKLTVKKAWTKEDAHYLRTVNRVKSLKDSVENVQFCPGANHNPLLGEQQRPYREQQKALMEEIRDYISDRWTSDQEPHQAYSELYKELHDIDFDGVTKLCDKCAPRKVNPGRGKPVTTVAPSCAYCSHSAEDIYNQLNSLYQQLYTKKITKAAAHQKADALYNCFKSHRKVKSGYGTKIAKFYNKIVSY